MTSQLPEIIFESSGFLGQSNVQCVCQKCGKLFSKMSIQQHLKFFCKGNQLFVANFENTMLINITFLEIHALALSKRRTPNNDKDSLKQCRKSWRWDQYLPGNMKCFLGISDTNTIYSNNSLIILLWMDNGSWLTAHGPRGPRGRRGGI